MNKFIKVVLIFFTTMILITGITYAGSKIIKIIKNYNKKESATIVPTFTGKLGDADVNSIWIGSFQLAWNEFIDNYIGKEIEFENIESDLVKELNKKVFTKEMLSQDSYYLKIGKTSPSLKQEILNDLKERFNINSVTTLENINFESINNSYTIYSILFKNFEFIQPFDKLEATTFGNYEQYVEYFGINNSSKETLNENVKVLFYNQNEYAVKLETKEDEEVILYKNQNKGSFMNLYQDVIRQQQEYKGNEKFQKDDEIKVPYINIDTIINYDELCGKYIKDSEGMYISNALQNIKFSLNEKGGNLISEATIKSEYFSEIENARYFYFTDNFVIFLKEKDSELPYFCAQIDNLDVLVLEDEY